jgi:hypothetical protein
MKAGTQNHLKVKRLMRLLAVPMYKAVGVLECLWLLCSDCCDEGDVGKYTDDEIADYLGWDGPQSASELVRALSDSGFLDPNDDCRYEVHDWLEHCPEYIRDRVRKRHARGSKARKQRTYVSPESDNGGTSADKPGHTPDQPPLVPSIPNQSQPNPTNKGADKPLLVFVDLPKQLDTPEFRIAWESWEQHRREKRSKLTPTATKQQIRQLAEWGVGRALSAIEHSIRQGYTGLFEPPEVGDRNRSQQQQPAPHSLPFAN